MTVWSERGECGEGVEQANMSVVLLMFGLYEVNKYAVESYGVKKLGEGLLLVSMFVLAVVVLKKILV